MTSTRLSCLAMLSAALVTTPLAGCGPSKAGAPDKSPIPTVTTAAPERSTIQETLEYTARLEPSQRIEVRSRLSGHLQSIHFRDGEYVKRGELLFVVDPRPLAAVRDRAAAGLAHATARLRLATAQHDRIVRMQRAGAASMEDLDRSRGEQEAAAAAVQLAQAELRNAELDVSFTEIRAPISGKISDRRVDAGNYVAGGGAQAQVLTTIVALDPVHAVVELSEADFQRLRQQPKLPRQAEWSMQGQDAPRPAAVDFIDNEISPRSGTVRLRARIANADGTAMPGNFIRVRLPIGEPRERLLVPDSAIQSDQARKMVLAVGTDGKVVPKRVELGAAVGTRRVVLSGLAPGDRIIVSGAQRVRPGDPVRIAGSDKRS